MTALGTLKSWRVRRVRKRLLDEDGPSGSEDVVRNGMWVRHPLIYASPALEALSSLVVLWVLPYSRTDVGWFFILLWFGVVAHAAYRALLRFMDVIVITDLRIFRMQGLNSTLYSSMPLKRIVDITVEQTSLGQLFGYAHFSFDASSGDRLLRNIKFISHPWRRDKVIQLRLAKLSGRSEHRP